MIGIFQFDPFLSCFLSHFSYAVECYKSLVKTPSGLAIYAFSVALSIAAVAVVAIADARLGELHNQHVDLLVLTLHCAKQGLNLIVLCFVGVKHLVYCFFVGDCY